MVWLTLSALRCWVYFRPYLVALVFFLLQQHILLTYIY